MSNKTSAFISRVFQHIAKNGNVQIFLDTVYDSMDDEVYIKWFERVGGMPGDGAKTLMEICRYADQMKIVLSLSTNPELIKYYENFGFVQDGPITLKNAAMYRFYNNEEDSW